MSEHNDILNNLGAPLPEDPLAIRGADDQFRQSAVRDKIEYASENVALRYDVLPIYLESFLLAVVEDLYTGDEVFPYDDSDELASKIVIANHWQRNLPPSRDQLPRIVVAHQSSGADHAFLRDDVETSLPSQGFHQTQSMQDMTTLRISAIHSNRTISLFLGQQIRSAVIAAHDVLREVFNLQKIYPPDLVGPAQVQDLPDRFGTYVTLRVETYPKWEKHGTPEYTARIVMKMMANAGKLVTGAIQQTAIDAEGI